MQSNLFHNCKTLILETRELRHRVECLTLGPPHHTHTHSLESYLWAQRTMESVLVRIRGGLLRSLAEENTVSLIHAHPYPSCCQSQRPIASPPPISFPNSVIIAFIRLFSFYLLAHLITKQMKCLPRSQAQVSAQSTDAEKLGPSCITGGNVK